MERLRSGLARPEPVLLVLYGRRRCWKSTLLHRCLAPTDVYYLASLEDAVMQREALAREIARRIPRFDALLYPSWAALLEALHDRTKEKICLALDEFPYLVQTSPELPSVLQKYWDGPGERKLSFLLCGSSQRMMQGLVLDHSAPLYGRATEILRLSPLAPGWISDALNMSPSRSVEAFSVWGGIPRYWELASSHASTEAVLAHVLLDRHGVLFDEPLRLLRDDLRGPIQAASLLALVGHGCHRLSEMAGRLGKPAGSLVRPLTQLIELGYVRRDYPFGETARSTRRTLYKVGDPFLRFYYRFIEPNRSRIELGLGAQVAAEIEARTSDYVASVWEDLARESTPHLMPGGREWKPAARWWGGDRDGRPMEVDVMAESTDGSAVLVGEAKWSAGKKSAETLHARLREKATRCPAVKGRTVVTALWLGNRKSRSAAELSFYTEADVLRVLR